MLDDHFMCTICQTRLSPGMREAHERLLHSDVIPPAPEQERELWRIFALQTEGGTST